MAKLSRTQRYQELRDHLDEETTQAQAAPVKSPRLSRVQSSSNSLPHAAKAYFPHEETEPRPAEPDLPTSPVIDELLGEVKQYNIDNGNRFTDDTQINILKQLDRPESEDQRRKAHVLPMEEPQEDFGSTMKMPRTSTRESVLELSSVDEQPASAPVPVQEKLTERRIVLTAGDIRADEFEENDQLDVLTTGRQETLENTVRQEKLDAPKKKKKKKKSRPAPPASSANAAASSAPKPKKNRKDTGDMPSAKMRIKVDDYDEELPARKQKNSSRTLNIVLGLLIVALIVAIAFMVYFVRSLGAL